MAHPIPTAKPKRCRLLCLSKCLCFHIALRYRVPVGMPSLDGILSISFPRSRQPGLRRDTVRAWVAEFESETQSSSRALDILEDTVEDSFLEDYEFEGSDEDSAKATAAPAPSCSSAFKAAGMAQVGDMVDLTMTSDSSPPSSVIIDLT